MTGGVLRPATAWDDAQWRSFERVTVRESMLVALEKRAATPLIIGEHVAWAEIARSGVATDDLSEVHRVAQLGDHPETYCGEAIPEAVRRLDLPFGWHSSMMPCRYCAQAYTLSLRGAA